MNKFKITYTAFSNTKYANSGNSTYINALNMISSIKKFKKSHSGSRIDKIERK